MGQSPQTIYLVSVTLISDNQEMEQKEQVLLDHSQRRQKPHEPFTHH
jgi:hypothetical protein